MSDAAATNAVNEARMLSVLDAMVRFPSWKGQEGEIADWVISQAAAWGGEAEVMEISPARRQANIRLRGRAPGRTLVLNGHLDIDPLAAGYRHDPWTMVREGDRVYGAGFYNMRGGLAAMIEATQMLRDGGGLAAGEIVLSFVIGHLQGGVGSKYLTDTYPRIGDAVIITEPDGARNIVTSSCGVLKLAIAVDGVAAHLTRRGGGVNAIAKMATVIQRLTTIEFTHTPRPDMPALPFLNVGGIVGGRGDGYDLTGSSFVSDRCKIIVDVRYLASQNEASVLNDIRHVLDNIAAADPEFRYRIEPQPAVAGNLIARDAADVPVEAEIVQTVARAFNAVTGTAPDSVGVLIPDSYGGTDLGYFYNSGIPGVVYGPNGGNGTPEAADTWVDVSEMTLCAAVIARAAQEFCAGAGNAA